MQMETSELTCEKPALPCGGGGYKRRMFNTSDTDLSAHTRTDSQTPKQSFNTCKIASNNLVIKQDSRLLGSRRASL